MNDTPPLVPLGDREDRRQRGAFFTPPAIADYLAFWAVRNNPQSTVLDPTCGGGVFLEAAGRRLQEVGAKSTDLRGQLFGIDLHDESINQTRAMLTERGMDATLLSRDFFATPAPVDKGSPLPQVDAVLGNPPFVRFQQHVGETRRLSAAAALRQGVTLPSNASSWAASLVHASGFMKPTGTLAWVVPAELLTVSYAEPVRQWLRRRFSFVRLVFFNRLQFPGANEQVVLLIASGTGGCESFSLVYADNHTDLEKLHALDVGSAVPSGQGKWTDMLLTMHERGLMRKVQPQNFVPLSDYGKVVLGTVTGANDYFCMNEETRHAWALREDVDVIRTVPSGTNKLTSHLSYTPQAWKRAKSNGERVWMLNPQADPDTDAVAAYLASGVATDVPLGYKCRTRAVWWRVPVVSPPDLFFTYMSHMKPRLIANAAGTTFLNSLHGIRLHPSVPKDVAPKLAITSMNSLTMLSAETSGRPYGGGVLKLEPTEAAALPVLAPQALDHAWDLLAEERPTVSAWLTEGKVDRVRHHVDKRILCAVLGLSPGESVVIQEAADRLRARRLGKPRP